MADQFSRSGDTRPATIDDLYAAMVEANDIVAGQRRRIAELEAALAVALTALCSWQSYMEATSDGMTRPSRETASRLYDQCSDAIAACDQLGINPVLTSEPED